MAPHRASWGPGPQGQDYLGPPHIWLLGRRADLCRAAHEGPPGSSWFPPGSASGVNCLDS